MRDAANILYIHSHDTGRYVQPYGCGVTTPNIQRLAEEGVLFRKAFCAAPTCSPSRASLLTGRWAHCAGMLGLVNRGFELPEPQTHLASVLAAGGYRTALVGMQHLVREPKRLGYQEIVPVAGNAARDVAPAASGFLDSSLSEPFFLSVGFSETHRDFHPATAVEDPRYAAPPAPLPDTPETRLDMARFQASALELDRGIGRVLRALADAGLAERTLVICTTDHGIAFPFMKCHLTDHGLGVMLIMRGPGGFGGGKVVDGMVSHVDVFPTLCEFLGIAPPEWLQGVSMMPLVTGEQEQIRDQLFGEVNFHDTYEPQRAVRTLRYKYIRRFTERERPFVVHCDGSPSKDLFMRHGWKQRVVLREQLYDLLYDPNEAANIAAQPASSEVLEDMKTRLNDWMKVSDDPLLKGPVVPPPEAIQSDPDDDDCFDLWSRRPRPEGYA
jgi:arylsulfatase A-like enzyme